jgi:hypothetical protein
MNWFEGAFLRSAFDPERTLFDNIRVAKSLHSSK